MTLIPLTKSDYLKIVAIVIAIIVTIGVVEYVYGYYVVGPRAIDEAYETAKTELQIWWSREGISMGVDRDQYYQMQNDLARSYGKPIPYPNPTSSSDDDLYERLDNVHKLDVLRVSFRLDLTGTKTNPQVTLTYTGELPDHLTDQQPPTQVYVNVRVGYAHSGNGTVEHFTELVQGWQHSWRVSQEDIKKGVWVTLGDGTVTTELAVGGDDYSALENTSIPSPTPLPTPVPRPFVISLENITLRISYIGDRPIQRLNIHLCNETGYQFPLYANGDTGMSFVNIQQGWTTTIELSYIPDSVLLNTLVVDMFISNPNISSRDAYQVG